MESPEPQDPQILEPTYMGLTADQIESLARGLNVFQGSLQPDMRAAIDQEIQRSARGMVSSDLTERASSSSEQFMSKSLGFGWDP